MPRECHGYRISCLNLDRENSSQASTTIETNSDASYAKLLLRGRWGEYYILTRFS